jgi:sulfur-carrier protein
MIVHIPSPLRSYTQNKGQVEVDAAPSLLELSKSLDSKYPGIRFRMIDEQDKSEVKTLAIPLNASDVVHITCALSGG